MLVEAFRPDHWTAREFPILKLITKRFVPLRIQLTEYEGGGTSIRELVFQLPP